MSWIPDQLSNGLPVTGKSGSGKKDIPASKQRSERNMAAVQSRELEFDDEEVQSLPKPAVVPDKFDFAGAASLKYCVCFHCVLAHIKSHHPLAHETA